jgi:hypothetical protein
VNAARTLGGVDGALGDPLDFEVVVASLRMGREDSGRYLSQLAERLGRALPGRVKVERAGLVSKKTKAVTCDVGDRIFRVEAAGAATSCTVASVVRGVVIRTDECTLDAWLADLSRELTRVAEHSQEVRAALDRLLG